MRGKGCILKGWALALSLLLWQTERLSAEDRRVRGVLQSEAHYASKTTNSYRLHSNSYLNLWAEGRGLSAAARLEHMPRPLPGLEGGAGWGLAYWQLMSSLGWAEVSLGDSYDQLGSGLLLRTYEDRLLGIDNSLRGLHLRLTPIEGLQIKASAGQQRNHFDRGHWGLLNRHRGFVVAGDVSLSLSEWISPLSQRGWRADFGLSLVVKSETDLSDVHLIQRMGEGRTILRLVAPRQVPAWSGRMLLQRGAWEVNGEFAYKWADPNRLNNYIFSSGSVAMLMTSYSSRGFSFMLGARRSENFDFRSQRSAGQLDLRINHLIPFTQQQSYTLSALRPYATQAWGEWAMQAELRYTIPRGTALGGRYGTQLRLSASHINALRIADRSELSPLSVLRGQTSKEQLYGSDGAVYSFLGFGEKYFHDITLEASRKLSRSYAATLSYTHQAYNQEVIEGHSDTPGLIRSHIFVYEGKHKLGAKTSLRTELQYLHEESFDPSKVSDKDRGHWLYAALELGLSPRWIISLSDQWASHSDQHYYQLSVAHSYKAHRLQLGWGRTRAGINCSGGVCRYVPETFGLNLSLLLSL
ncbi:DUF6029 family protein [Porphyromonas sp. COT-239 OH1446]|uniref:DUF6029 family protein n=1 Tax=Porphyromonas sp. COT-239 OH1446 TaxID=1515613 RepID=UPI00068A4E65|nr:DUF6029 family protein [Porphyromonas sp. COT-239 OH1446]